MKIISLIRTVFSLGLVSVLLNIFYKLALRCGIIKYLTRDSWLIDGPLLNEIHGDFKTGKIAVQSCIVDEANYLLEGKYRFFFSAFEEVGSPPNWHLDFIGQSTLHWSNVSFSTKSDIKLTWDLSRFSWAQLLAISYLMTGEKKFLDNLCSWIENWTFHNRVNHGVNWSCAQECSIRVINFLNVVWLLGDELVDTKFVEKFVIAHCRRIRPTLIYSISQDNNHGISEAAALFICGGWLKSRAEDSNSRELGRKFYSLGSNLLKNRVKKLVLADGGFAMYSTNYHRVVLNTLSVVEVWRVRLGVPAFSSMYLHHCEKATLWLFMLCDEQSGDVPNIGANDGSNPFIIQRAGYRDYRPSIQLASQLFLKRKLYPDSCFANDALDYLLVSHEYINFLDIEKTSCALHNSGIVVLRSKDVSLLNSTGYVKYPNYEFRPIQSDILHFDLWVNGRNVLRDGGSYSYNGNQEVMDHLAGIKGHNTLNVDEIEPMPKISPFLLSRWAKLLRPTVLERTSDYVSWEGEYRISSSILHSRKVSFRKNTWDVMDKVHGAEISTVVRWRLDTAEWIINGNTVVNENIQIKLIAKVGKIVRFELVDGYESRFYNSYTRVPVLEVELKGKDVEVITRILVEGVK